MDQLGHRSGHGRDLCCGPEGGRSCRECALARLYDWRVEDGRDASHGSRCLFFIQAHLETAGWIDSVTLSGVCQACGLLEPCLGQLPEELEATC